MRTHDFKVHGENNQDLGRYLPKLEAELSKGAFFNRLCHDAELDPENFLIGNVEIEMDEGPRMFPVVVGEHVRKRMNQRTFETLDGILAKAIYWLRCPMIGRRVLSHPVIWNEELLKAVPFEDDGIDATAVFLEKEDLVLCFEAGFHYIRVKTIFKGVERFHPSPSTKVILVAKSGAVRLLPNNQDG